MNQISLRPRSRDDFKIAVVCALPLEAEMVQSVFDKDLDEDVDYGQAEGDQNVYTTGIIGKHAVVLAYMPGAGSTNAAAVAAGLRSSYTKLEVAFVVGICGVSPEHPETSEEIILGDCIIGTTIVQYDYGKRYPGSFIRKPGLDSTLDRASPATRALVSKLQTAPTLKRLSSKLVGHLEILQRKIRRTEYPGYYEDLLFEDSYLHTHHGTDKVCDACINDLGVCTQSCEKLKCERTKLVERDRLNKSNDSQSAIQPQVHFGRYGSANTVLKSGIDRERLSSDEKIVAFEMEGAGVLDSLPTIMVKSACDYADSHKNKKWQRYAAAVSAAGLKSILEYWRISAVNQEQGHTTQKAFNVPIHAVTHFVKRNLILNELDNWLLDDGQQERVILRGIGGAGKSQLALECCRRAVSSEQYMAVLWVDASSIFSVHQSFKVILEVMEGSHAVSLDAKENVQGVAGNLQRKQGRWLIVFDNFDSPRDFQNDPITGYIPNAANAKILFTSRDADSDRLGRTINVQGMTEEESLDLLLKRPVRVSKEKEYGLQIATELGHLALALDQAEAYIRARGLTLEDFVTHFKERKKTILQEIPQHWEYRRTKTDAEKHLQLSAFTTWELSFEQISGSTRVKRHKEHFLTLCALFAPSSISRDYFEKYCQRYDEEWTSLFKRDNGADWDSFRFDDLLAECRKLSLLQTEEEYQNQQTSISFHPLIRDWLKLRKTAQERQEVAQEFTDILTCFISAVELENLPWTTKQLLFANINSCLHEDDSFGNENSGYTVHTSYSMETFAGALCSSGFYTEALELNKRVLAERRSVLGSKHIDTLRAIYDLATTYLYKGRFNEAEKLYNELLRVLRKRPEPAFPNWLGINGNLAFLYQEQERFDEAEKLYKDVLAGYRKKVGPEDSNTIRVMVDLASVYQEQERYDEAEELFKEVLASTKHLEPQHRYRMSAKRGLAYNVLQIGRFDEAREIFEQVLAVSEKQFGPKHPDTLWVMANLAHICTQQGRDNDAEDLHKRVLAGRMERLGPSHHETLRTLNNLGTVYSNLGQYDNAEKFYKQALAGRTEVLGPDHHDTLHTQGKLNGLRRRRGQTNYSPPRSIPKPTRAPADEPPKKRHNGVSRLFKKLRS